MEKTNILYEILKTDGAAFAIITTLLLAAFWVVNRVTKILTDHNNFAKNLDKLDHVKSSVDEMRGVVNLLANKNNPFAQKESPISLTDAGKDLVKAIGLENMLENQWEKIHSMILEEKLDNAYDIQEFCISLGGKLDSILTHDDIQKIKKDAFLRGVDLIYYASVVGVILRDKYFSIHDIDISDVDAFDPNKPNVPPQTMEA